MTSDVLIDLRSVRREYPSGESTLVVLKDIDLTIRRGEKVAIMGASGSGKSTLMHILGCLDRPSAGSYLFDGREVDSLAPDELAGLRREHFGFIFQRYHLLSDLTAVDNVAVPAVYAGIARRERLDRAAEYLALLGLSQRGLHRPNELSGGQQQRVSIARALMNGGDVILADEPTGALDTQSSQEVMKILDELHAAGKTIVIVTHDAKVAAQAHRIIEIEDGRIISDRPNGSESVVVPPDDKAVISAGNAEAARTRHLLGALGRYREATRTALLTMRANPLRTFLTMLGIIVGIASVVSVVALGEGSRQTVLSQISSLGTNTLEIFPGANFGDVHSNKIRTLVVSDATALATQPYVAGVTPTVNTQETIRYGEQEASALINGVGAEYFAVKGVKLQQGNLFDEVSVSDFSQDAVIDVNSRQALFPHGENPIGAVIWVGDLPCTVIGVVASGSGGFGSSENPSVYLPYTTVQARITGDRTLRSVLVRVSDKAEPDAAAGAVTRFLTRRHGSKDFFILNTDDIRKTISSATETLSLLILSIALISLVVGGIGVMNIMVVSVTERIGEIGIRMAVGARRSDILHEVLIEAVLICLIAGALGIALAFAFGAAFNTLGLSFKLIYSGTSMIAAFLCSSLIGIAFGYLPARNASKLDPVAALSHE